MNARLGIFCAVLLSVAGGAPSATSAEDRVLDRNQCRIIEEFDGLHGPGAFVDRFIHMAHSTEWCKDGNEFCDIPIHKWIRNFKIKGSLLSARRHENLKVCTENVRYYINYMKNYTGLEISLANELPPSEHGVNVILYREDEFDQLWDLAPKEKRVIDVLIGPGSQCVVSIYPIEGNREIFRARIYVGLDQDPRIFANCVKEELFNASGFFNDPIGYPSLFDEKYARSSEEPLVYESYSEVEHVLMKILYLEVIQTGSSSSKSRQIISEIIHDSCGV